MTTFIIFIIALVLMYAVCRYEKEVENRKKHGWSRYDSNNRYSPNKLNNPSTLGNTCKKINYNPFNPKEPTPT